MPTPGKINARNRARQIIDFSGLRYKKITVSDIDGKIHFFEIRRQIFVFIEIKYNGKECENGQRWAFEHLVEIIPVPCIYIIADHQVEKWEQDVIGHLCIVRKYYLQKGDWVMPKGHPTLKTVVDKFLRKHGFQDYIKHVPL